MLLLPLLLLLLPCFLLCSVNWSDKAKRRRTQGTGRMRCVTVDAAGFPMKNDSTFAGFSVAAAVAFTQSKRRVRAHEDMFVSVSSRELSGRTVRPSRSLRFGLVCSGWGEATEFACCMLAPACRGRDSSTGGLGIICMVYVLSLTCCGSRCSAAVPSCPKFVLACVLTLASFSVFVFFSPLPLRCSARTYNTVCNVNRHMKTLPRRFKNGFQEGSTAPKNGQSQVRAGLKFAHGLSCDWPRLSCSWCRFSWIWIGFCWCWPGMEYSSSASLFRPLRVCWHWRVPTAGLRATAAVERDKERKPVW